MPNYAYDGHAGLRGVWGGNPSNVPNGYAHQAQNRWFREDRNSTRPKILNVPLEFESEDERIFFQGANGQGAFFYNAYPSFLPPKLIASIGGRIYTIEIQGRKGVVTKLFDGNAREFCHAWFAQGFEWLFIQDGIHAPIFWNGNDVLRRSDTIKNEMPIGSVMEFIHGRMVVASADGKNSVRLSEIAFANTNANHNDILSFPPELPTFETATYLGNITGLKAMPFLDTGNAQNELVALCQYGFTSFDFRGDEASLLGQIQKISLIGTGCVSSHGFDSLNSDLFFRSPAGINTYRNARIQYSQSWNQTPISREVKHWIDQDRTDLLEFIPMISWQNMVLTGCSPLVSPPSNPCFGYHRFCRGMVVFDADAMSTAGREGSPVWHGCWTGVRPWAFVQGQIGNSDRCFTFSYDRDGRNRLYELTLQRGDDQFEQESRKIFSFYTTQDLGIVEGRTNAFEPKLLNGGIVELNNIIGSSTFHVEHRPDGGPCWVEVDEGAPGCDCPTRECTQFSAPIFTRKYLEQVNRMACVPGTSNPAGLFRHTQVRMRLEGVVDVERFALRMDPQPDSQIAACLGNDCLPIECCPDAYDYVYHIAPAGSNSEVPDLNCPINPARYTSTRTWFLACADAPSLTTIGFGQGESATSQQDADSQALAAAKLNAQESLDCPNCVPQVLVSTIVDGGSINYSSQFIPEKFANNINQPWRMIDAVLVQLIAYGIVNPSGTLETTTLYPDYSGGSFNPGTHIYTDNGSGHSIISLQMGCNTPTGVTWPDDHTYV